MLPGWFAALVAAQAQGVAVVSDLWDRPRTARAVLAEPAVRQAVAAWISQAPARLSIHHAPGQEAPVQAEELRAWLIALGIEAERVTLRGDLRIGEPLRLEVSKD